MSMVIRDIHSAHIKGAVEFKYRGFAISCTNIPLNAEVAIFEDFGRGRSLKPVFSCSAEGVRDAMDLIDALLSIRDASVAR